MVQFTTCPESILNYYAQADPSAVGPVKRPIRSFRSIPASPLVPDPFSLTLLHIFPISHSTVPFNSLFFFLFPATHMRGTCATSSCRQMRLIRNFTSSCFPRYTIYSSRGEHWGDWSGSQSHIQRALPALQRTASTVQLRNDKIDFPSVIDGKLLPPQFSLPNASAAPLLPPPIFISPILYRPSMVIVMSSYEFSFLYHQPWMRWHKNRTTTAVNFLMIPHNYSQHSPACLSVCTTLLVSSPPCYAAAAVAVILITRNGVH